MKVFYRRERVGPAQRNSLSINKTRLADWLKVFGNAMEVWS